MKHEKIIKREDGSRVKILVDLESGWLDRDCVKWEYAVRVCAPNKRTWLRPYDPESFLFRRLNKEDKERFIFKEMLKHVTKEELQEAAMELWNKIKPTL
jgi:hypothetical protein